MKVKLFSSDEYYKELEREVNMWLESHPNVKIDRILQSQSRGRDELDYNNIAISIWYET